MKRIALVFVLVALVATPAYAASNPKKTPTQFMWCPNDPGKSARIWVELGKTWTADNQCGHGTWLSIGWGVTGSSDSNAELVLVAPKTRFGPRKQDVPRTDGWWGASLTTNPEFYGCQGGDTYAVWPNSKGVFDVTC